MLFNNCEDQKHDIAFVGFAVGRISALGSLQEPECTALVSSSEWKLLTCFRMWKNSLRYNNSIFFPLLRPISLWGSVLGSTISGKSKTTRNQKQQRRHANLPARFAFRQQEKHRKGPEPQPNTHTKNHRICLGHGGKSRVIATCTFKTN